MIVLDQMNRKVEIVDIPKRVVSLVPSQTELLVSIGLADHLIGVTKFCVHPNWIKKDKTIVGGTKNYRMEIIETLQPDLIIGNKEENDQDGIELLSQKYPVWMSDISNLKDNYEMIAALGAIFQMPEKAKALNLKIKDNFSQRTEMKGSAVYLIWNDPIMVAGRNTFIDHMLKEAGFENLVQTERYPELTLRELQALNPEYLLLSSEPFPFKKKHLNSFIDLFPATKVYLVDGEYFSWYGSRLLSARRYFDSLA